MDSNHDGETAGKILVKVAVSNLALDDILATCFVGGSNYWIDKIAVVEGDYRGAKHSFQVISRGGKVWIYVKDDKEYLLTEDKLLTGCEIYANSSRTWEPDHFDAEDTDLILQYALFGDIVYG
jgi:hypothetical protein